MITIYNTCSADGFIARNNGSEDFIPDEVFDDFLGILQKYDAVVMGSKTYETIQAYPKSMIAAFETIETKRIVVSRDASYKVKQNYSVISDISEIPKCGNNILITSGPNLNSAALRAGIIDRIVLNIIPEKIKVGIPVFDKPPELELLSTITKPASRKICSYKIKS